jgi:hypothetical protein
LSLRRGLSAALALFLLDVALTLQDVWPTPGVQWAGEVSVEITVLVLVLALLRAARRRPLARVARPLAVLLVVLAIGRYAAITAPALYGRPINLYWDLPHVTHVVGMLTRVAPSWAIAGVVLVVIALCAGLYVVMLWCLRRVLDALESPRVAVAAAVVASLVLLAYSLPRSGRGEPRVLPFAEPVLATYAAQARLIVDGLSGSAAAAALPASPALASDLAALSGGDVLVLFLESYGSSTYDRPAYAAALAPAREQLAQAIRQTHREVVSAFVESPTFGGGSWLAHLSLMSGIEVRDPARYALLMTRQRDTLATPFRQHGYRTVAMMPGLRLAWPEGRFYRFDAIHDAASLAYTGPEFGWFHIPDQFSLATLEQRELRPAPRAPVFALFPTLSTHLPFRPTPPYQPDWQRMLGSDPYDAAVLKNALAETPSWLDMGDGYVAAVQYALQMVSGFLIERADPAMVLVLLGDHQPAANTSGENASWDVPVHIITGNARVLAKLRAAGFDAGLAPRRARLGRMDELAPVLLRAFDGS